jgi:predicted CXXCH cytochrome family protein
LFVVFFSGCSSQSRFRVLSIFFDGVPNPDAKVVVVDSLNTRKNKIPNTRNMVKSHFTFHEPFQKKQCGKCHSSDFSNSLLENIPDLCYKCHMDFRYEYEALHGPVASGACTMCHQPHRAKYEKLIKRKGREICLYCHDLGNVVKNDAHEGEGETNCIDCHDPHGGDDEFFF